MKASFNPGWQGSLAALVRRIVFLCGYTQWYYSGLERLKGAGEKQVLKDPHVTFGSSE